MESKVPSISGLATNAALTAVENKIPNVSNLVTKTDYNTKINEIEKKITDHDHDKYITTPEFNKLTAENFAARLKQVNLVIKTDFDNKLMNHNLVDNELKKIQTFDSSPFIGQNYFNNDGAQLFLTFQPIFKTIATFSGLSDRISEWESTWLSNEKNMLPYTTSKSFSKTGIV